MYKYLRSGLLVFTNNGFKKIEDINKTEGDKILIYKNGGYEYGEIDNIEKVYKKKYKLNKIGFTNSIDNYYVNDNIKIRSIVNIPTSIETITDIPEYLDYNKNRCISMSCVSNLSSFDFIGFPTDIDIHMAQPDPSLNIYYRFQGLLISKSANLSFYVNKANEETISFIIDNLKLYDVSYELDEHESNVIIKYDNKILNDKIKMIDMNDVYKIHKDQLYEFVKGLIEINNEFIIQNRNIYQLIKYICLRLGFVISSYYKDDKYYIKMSKKLNNMHYNYFNYNNNVWNKIRIIKKIDYSGFLYRVTLMDECPYLTELGFIS